MSFCKKELYCIRISQVSNKVTLNNCLLNMTKLLPPQRKTDIIQKTNNFHPHWTWPDAVTADINTIYYLLTLAIKSYQLEN